MPWRRRRCGRRSRRSSRIIFRGGLVCKYQHMLSADCATRPICKVNFKHEASKGTKVHEDGPQISQISQKRDELEVTKRSDPEKEDACRNRVVRQASYVF